MRSLVQPQWQQARNETMESQPLQTSGDMRSQLLTTICFLLHTLGTLKGYRDLTFIFLSGISKA